MLGGCSVSSSGTGLRVWFSCAYQVRRFSCGEDECTGRRTPAPSLLIIYTGSPANTTVMDLGAPRDFLVGNDFGRCRHLGGGAYGCRFNRRTEHERRLCLLRIAGNWSRHSETFKKKGQEACSAPSKAAFEQTKVAVRDLDFRSCVATRGDETAPYLDLSHPTSGKLQRP